MNEARFYSDMAGDIGGVRWRVVQGRKSSGDLRLDICAPQFVPVKMTLGFLFADFYAENERTLAEQGYLSRSVATNPGRRYLNFLEGAQLFGWEAAAAQLEAERTARREREAA